MVQLFHEFGIDFETYAERGQRNHFPEYYSCPCCDSNKRLYRHGFYWRYGITDIAIQRIPVCRLLCKACRKTFSVLPSFLIPYFQYTLNTVMNWIMASIRGYPNQGNRQLVAFYVKRFFRQFAWIHMFFADRGRAFPLKGQINTKEKAIKYMTMIRDFGESTFLRRSKGHLSSYFMAPF